MPSRSGMSVRRALVVGGLVVGAMDLIAASVYAISRGGTAAGVWKFVASGLLGRSAFEGGSGTILLGVALHFFIAFTVVAVYVLASLRMPVLAGHPLPLGALYGVLVYVVMTFLVIPLSAAVPGRRTATGMLIMLGIHIFVIGIPTALFARAVRSEPVL
jgi:hypothetical protein